MLNKIRGLVIPENGGQKTNDQSLSWQFLKATPVFVLTILITLVVGRAGLLRQLETTALDTQLRLHGVSAKQSDIAIVNITDDDYKELFKSKSPLDPMTLKTVLGAIALGNPKVIGVDIDTSAPRFQDLQAESGWPPIVWARAGIYSKVKSTLHLFDVVGGQRPAPLSGAIMLKEDPDGALRRYSRTLKTEEGEFPSLPSVLAHQFDPVHANAGNTEELFISYTGSEILHIGASQIIKFAKNPSWPENELIKDKIVLLGGAYEASDEHDTPLGWKNGVDVLAYATETELEGGGPKPAPRSAIILLQIFDGVLLLLIFQLLRLRKAVLISLIALPVLSFICSVVAFRSVAFWAYFAPILIAVLAQQLYDHGKDYHKKLIKGLSERVGNKVQDENLAKERRVVEKDPELIEGPKRRLLTRRLFSLGKSRN